MKKKQSNKGVPLLGERPIPDQIMYIATKVEQHDDTIRLLAEGIEVVDGKIDRLEIKMEKILGQIREDIRITQNILKSVKVETDEEIDKLKKAVFVN
ncbi:MAG: hypothetical protein Q7S68_03890 [Deltaproteobacteria bacterium]|nr:hypothetical protein [Deltaproteobacteria bacterium]